MSGQSGGRRLQLSKLNDQLTCQLCHGYFIDATKIVECMHSFCRSCIVKHLKNNEYCPICGPQKSKRVVKIKPDNTLQDIIYKLIPGCYQNEMRRRREFYSKHLEAKSEVISPEDRGEPIESYIYSPDESLSLSLEYFKPNEVNGSNVNNKEVSSKCLRRRYLRCPAAVTVFHLQKLIRAKYGLSDTHRVDIMYEETSLCPNYTLMDVMYIYHWRRKVPLHLSYRIFESSPKRIKLSEDSIDYKKSLSNAGIDTVETDEKESPKREWKEVQLKISETGVMSVTDISSSELKKCTEKMENPQHFEEVVIAPPVKQTDALDDDGVKKEDQEKTESHQEMIKKSSPSVVSKSTTQTSSKKSNDIGKPEEETLTNQDATKTNDKLKTPNAKSQLNEMQIKIELKNCNSIDKGSLRATKSAQNKKTLQTDKVANNNATSSSQETSEKKQLSNNKNLSTENKLDVPKQNPLKRDTKSDSGSKIDALSAKLQFQPKLGQVNNTYSKKNVKEKKNIICDVKKLETKVTGSANSKVNNKTSTIDNAKTPRLNATSSPIKATVPSNIEIQTKSATSGTSQPSLSVSSQPSSSVEDPNANNVQCSRNIVAANVMQALSLLDRSIESPDRVSMTSDSSSTKTTVTMTSPQKHLPYSGSTCGTALSDSLASIGLNVSTTSPMNPTFPYTVQDLVSTSSTTSKCSNVQPKSTSGSSGQDTTTSSSDIRLQSTSASQFSVHTLPMSTFIASTSTKNDYKSPSPSINTIATSKQEQKSSFEISSVYSPPPCPAAIPISSYLKSGNRKQDVIAKGTNLNEICAKIGTSGSKINDICAKIGESSKEKNKVENSNKSEIPDLLKIAKKIIPMDHGIKHPTTNIPIVPIYTPSSTSDNKILYGNKDTKNVMSPSISATQLASTSHSITKSSLKKQCQSIGYKTLRDPPKTWNPTLSKNNYVAVKNQIKDMQNQAQSTATEGNKSMPSKPHKIFKIKNMPTYLGNPTSGVKPMYGVTNESKEKDQLTTKSGTLNMMKIDPKTLSPIVSTVNSPIVSPPPYSPTARSYQNTPFPRDICRTGNTGPPLSPRNSPVNMLSTNPFIPSPTPNTNPRLIFSHFGPPSPEASRFSSIGIPHPSAFHNSLPPSINKLCQRSTYVSSQVAGYSQQQQTVQPPAVQRIPPSTHPSSTPKSPKKTCSTPVSSQFLGKNETPSSREDTMTTPTSTKSVDNMALQLAKSVNQQNELNAFNLSKTGIMSPIPTSSSVESTVGCAKQSNSSPKTCLAQSKQTCHVRPSIETTSKSSPTKEKTPSPSKTKPSTPPILPSVSSQLSEEQNKKGEEIVETKENTENSKSKAPDKKRNPEKNETKEKLCEKVNGDAIIDHPELSKTNPKTSKVKESLEAKEIFSEQPSGENNSTEKPNTSQNDSSKCENHSLIQEQVQEEKVTDPEGSKTES